MKLATAEGDLEHKAKEFEAQVSSYRDLQETHNSTKTELAEKCTAHQILSHQCGELQKQLQDAVAELREAKAVSLIPWGRCVRQKCRESCGFVLLCIHIGRACTMQANRTC